MSEWITDRLPTEDDAPAHCVWTMHQGCVEIWHYKAISSGEPWQPIPRPAPYVKPKRWMVTWEQKGSTTLWTLCSYDEPVHTLHGDLPDYAAEQIADIYNEVLP